MNLPRTTISSPIADGSIAAAGAVSSCVFSCAAAIIGVSSMVLVKSARLSLRRFFM